MARPAKRFTEDEANKIWLQLHKTVMAPDFYTGLKVPAHICTCAEKHLLVAQAQSQFVAIERAPSSERPELLKTWLDTYLETEAWIKVQAALRQRRVTKGSGSNDRLVLMSANASIDFDDLAKVAGFTKKEFMERLGRFLRLSKHGHTALTMHFGDFCAIEDVEAAKRSNA